MFAYAYRPFLAGVFAVAGWAACGGGAQATSTAMQVNGFTGSPVGYTAFCKTTPTECVAHGADAPVALDEARWKELQELNGFANHIIIPETDLEHYKKEEVWALPEVYGDCEDFVLLKRKWLSERGWPTGALLVTVVFDEVGDGHAVLVVRTDRGELVLDNKSDTIRPWYQTPYRFVKRQSVRDPNRWVSLGDPRWSTTSTATPQ